MFDGDNVRHGLCGDLGFSDVAQRENIRRIGEASKLFVDAGLMIFTSLVSPFRIDCQQLKNLLRFDFIGIYCSSPLEVRESRDAKGLYAPRAKSGEINEFKDIPRPYEEPEAAEIVVDIGRLSLERFYTAGCGLSEGIQIYQGNQFKE